MGQLVSDHVEGFSEVSKQSSVPVAEHHLLSVPKCIIEVRTAVNICIQAHSAIVNGIAFQYLIVKLAGNAETFKRPIDGLVGRR
jgi:hypothetical protein